MNNIPPLISIITLNYNNLRATLDFLESTKNLSYSNFEIIVVDNASEINPTNEIMRNHPHIKVIVNKSNLGFSGGNNVGLTAANGEFYLFINNDTIVTTNLLEELLEPFKINHLIGVVSPKILYFEQPTIIQYAGFTKINRFTGRNKAIGHKEEDKGQYNNGRYTEYAHGAAMMVKREVVEKTGAFCDIFFLYYEELDWCDRIRKSNFSIYYQPNAKIYHKESMTVGKNSHLKTFYMTRNRILFMRRNNDIYSLIVFCIYFTIVTIPMTTISLGAKLKFIHLKLFFKGIIWNMKNHYKS